MRRIAIFASGNGTNFECLAKAITSKQINAELSLLVCNKKDAYVLTRAKKFSIETLVLSLKDCESKEHYEKLIVEKLQSLKIDLICLAGYMLLCGPTLLTSYEGKIINIHPALLPSFPGAHSIIDSYHYGVKVFGVTIHYVDSGIDSGRIIAQKAFEATGEETLEEIECKIHALEYVLYPQVVKKILEELDESTNQCK